MTQNSKAPGTANAFPGLFFLNSSLEKKDWREAVKNFGVILNHLAKSDIDSVSDELQQVAVAVERLLTSEELEIAPNERQIFVRSSSIVANLFSATNIGSSNSLIEKVSKQKNNFYRLLALLSHKNKIDKKSLEEIFAADREHALLWLSSLLGYAQSAKTKEESDNITALISSGAYENNFRFGHIDEILNFPELMALYFRATYLADEEKEFEGSVRSSVNKELQRLTKDADKAVSGSMKVIAVLSEKFHRNHAVYRALKPLLAGLKGTYKLIYFYTGSTPMQPGWHDDELFDELVTFPPGKKNYNSILEIKNKVQEKNAGIVIFPDISLSAESIILSNMRIAPVQVAFLGHPVFTYGAKIDYFITGAEVTDKQSTAEDRLAIIQGQGQVPLIPNYKLQGRKKADKFTIGCNWGDIKFYYPHMQNVKEICERAKRPVRLVFFGINKKRLDFIITKKQLEDFFAPAEVIVSGEMKLDEYMAALENIDLLIDSFPFGSYTRAVDAIAVKVPLLTLKGKKPPSRAAAALLSRAVLGELVATSKEEFIKKGAKLINDEAYYERTCAPLSSGTALNAIRLIDEGDNLLKAMDVIANLGGNIKAAG